MGPEANPRALAAAAGLLPDTIRNTSPSFVRQVANILDKYGPTIKDSVVEGGSKRVNQMNDLLTAIDDVHPPRGALEAGLVALGEVFPAEEKSEQ